MKRNYTISTLIISALLTVLFVYTASSKLMDFTTFQQQMINQPIPKFLGMGLAWTLPPIELITGIMLVIPVWRKWGLILSFLLMLAFTGYIGLVWLNAFERVPCSCGGVLRRLGWGQHLVFNLMFLLLATAGLWIAPKDSEKLANT